jgi:ATP-dependent DNA helicase UvrD/PcrA
MVDLLARLNPEQRCAVEHGQGPALVLAGAGSGKTRVIAYRIAYLMQNSASRPENILAVTFTNKAAQEMRERIHLLMGPHRPSEPLISTFHSLCVRILRREIHLLGYRKDFSIYDTDDQKQLIKQIMEDSELREADFSQREALSRISYAKNHNILPEHYSEHFPSANSSDIQRVYIGYNRRLRMANALDFDDLLLKTVEVMEKYPAVRDHYSNWYRYILVDEYQDTNRPQYELLRQFTSRHPNLFVVGDEDQSIYKFRGADIKNILNFERDFPGTRIFKLEQNYRSTQNILRVAGAVVENNTERKGKTLWTENHAGDVVTCRRFRSARSEAEWVAARIQELLDENPDFHLAILYRANFLSRNFEEVFLARGLPFTVLGGVAFFQRMEVKDMLAYLRVVFNPEDDVALLRIINTPPRGIGSTTVDALTQAALQRQVPVFHVLQEFARNQAIPGRASRPLNRFIEMLELWMSRRDSASLAELLEKIVEDIDYRAMLEKQESPAEAESRMSNIAELAGAAAESEQRGETVFEFLDRASLSSELDRYDPNARTVLMTLHSAKGLEFDAVFLAGLEEGLFPHAQSMAAQDLEEERRLCYVGITRARHKLFLTWTPFRRNFGPEATLPSPPSRFFSEMPPELVEGIGESYVYDQREQYLSEEETPSDGRSWIDLLNEQIARTAPSGRGRPGRHTSGEPGPAFPPLKSGMRVRHAQFGDGIILNRERVGDDVKLTVTFSRVGKKTLIERYAKLQPLR